MKTLSVLMFVSSLVGCTSAPAAPPSDPHPVFQCIGNWGFFEGTWDQGANAYVVCAALGSACENCSLQPNDVYSIQVPGGFVIYDGTQCDTEMIPGPFTTTTTVSP